jgi:hypothetical protein
MSVRNAKHDSNHCRATVVFIVVMGQLNVHLFKQEKNVAKRKYITITHSLSIFFLASLCEIGGGNLLWF